MRQRPQIAGAEARAPGEAFAGDWLRRALERIDLFVVFFDERGRIVGCNDFVLAVTGWDRDTLIGNPWPETASGTSGTSASAQDPLFGPYDSEVVTRKGERRVVRWHDTVIPDPDGAGAVTVSVGEDVTEQHRMQETMRRSEARYRAFIAQSSEGIWRLELDPPVPVDLGILDQVARILESGRIVECNDAMAKLHGRDSAEDLAGVRLSELYAVGGSSTALFEAFVRGGYRLTDFESSSPGAHGSPRCLVQTLTGVVDGGRLARVWGIQRDETERAARLARIEQLHSENVRQAEELRLANQDLERRIRERTKELELVNEQLLEQATSDGLTGLANRRHFNTVLGLEIRRARRDGSFLSLLLCDVDFFKRFNDRYGHLAGDQCLVAIATALGQNFRRATDLCARFGGEEFAVILSNCGPDDAQRLAERLRESVVRERILHAASDVAGHITISVGVVSTRVTAETTPDTIVEQADQALYASKEGGRNRVTVLSPGTPAEPPKGLGSRRR